MKQSQYDPTLKAYFTQEEARQWIRHLEKIIESLEKKLKVAGSKNLESVKRNTELRRKYKRLIAKIEFLQEQHHDINFGLEEFIKPSKEHDA